MKNPKPYNPLPKINDGESQGCTQSSSQLETFLLLVIKPKIPWRKHC